MFIVKQGMGQEFPGHEAWWRPGQGKRHNG